MKTVKLLLAWLCALCSAGHGTNRRTGSVDGQERDGNGGRENRDLPHRKRERPERELHRLQHDDYPAQGIQGEPSETGA